MNGPGGGDRESTQDRAAALGAWVFWGFVLALGFLIFFRAFLPALEDSARTRAWVGSLRDDILRLREERERLTLQRDGLKTDPLEMERALRKHARGPQHWVPVVEEASPKGR